MKQVFLSDVCEINPRMDSGISDDAECSFVPMEHVDDISGTIAKTDIRLVGDVKKGYTFFKNDDVIFAKITPCMENGKCAIGRNLRNGIAFGSTEFHVVRAKEGIIPEWVYYYLRQERVRQSATHWFRGTAGQQRVPALFLEELKIPLPPLDEQKRIAALLGRADRLRGLRRAARELGESLLQGVFLEMFGDVASNSKNWDIATLEDLETDFIYGTSQKCFSEPKGFPVLRIPNVLHGIIDFDDLKYAEVPDKEAKNILLKNGDIIFVRTNGNPDYVGRCAVFGLEEDFLFASYLIRARLDLTRINPVFLLIFLQTAKGREAMAPYIRTTAGQSNIGIEGLSQIPVPLPPLSLQEEFARVVARVEGLRGRMSESERQVEGLFQSLLAESFA